MVTMRGLDVIVFQIAHAIVAIVVVIFILVVIIASSPCASPLLYRVRSPFWTLLAESRSISRSCSSRAGLAATGIACV